MAKDDRRVIKAAFDGDDIVSDGGILPLLQADRRIRLIESIARAFEDGRRRPSIKHGVHKLLPQKMC